MKLLLGLLALAVLILNPGLVTALLGAVGALAVTAASQPACWAFTCGLLAANRHRNRTTAPKAGQA